MVKNPPAVRETQVQSLGWEDPLENRMATHSRILTWRMLWTEEPSGLQSMGLQRVGHNWATHTLRGEIGWDWGHSQTSLCSEPSCILAALHHTCKSRWLCESTQLFPSSPLRPSSSSSSLDSLCGILPLQLYTCTFALSLITNFISKSVFSWSQSSNDQPEGRNAQGTAIKPELWCKSLG